MVIFNLISDRFPDLGIDISTKEPFEFEIGVCRAGGQRNSSKHTGLGWYLFQP